MSGAPDKVPATDDATALTSQGSGQQQSNGRALNIRYRIACLSIRFWHAVHSLAGRRYDAALARQRIFKSRINLRGVLREVCR